MVRYDGADLLARIIKWIKGALIGAGSFGSVFLGMDAQSGLLMAVKQVELPTGSARNEERKKSMVDALEREIELLKELQHDNIVQYLGGWHITTMKDRPDCQTLPRTAVISTFSWNTSQVDQSQHCSTTMGLSKRHWYETLFGRS